MSQGYRLDRLADVLTITRGHWLQMLAEAWDRYPLEGCGLLFGATGADVVDRFVPIVNVAKSSRIYRFDDAQYVAEVMAAADDGLEIIGVMHSHTHTVAYPSSTDVAGAINSLIPPSWHWVIVSLGSGYPELRSFLIFDGAVEEESVEVMHADPTRLFDQGPSAP